MKTLVLLTSQFPFGTSESFLESEFPYLNNYFDKLIIIAQNNSGEMTRRVPQNVIVHRYNPSSSFTEYLTIPILVLSNLSEISILFKEETGFRRRIGSSINLNNFLLLFKKIVKALQLRNFINAKLLNEYAGESIVFYSYWLKTGAHAITMLEYRNSIKVARAHGSDLYEERTNSGYLPLMTYTAKRLDAIFFTSSHGKDYFSEKTKIKSEGFIVSRLGVSRPESDGIKLHNPGEFVIVSCSNMIPLKRIELIIYALEILRYHKKILWLHFGDGVLRKELEKLASDRLGSTKGISYRFLGHYPNNELLEYYNRNKVDLFINTSSTEGIPVSIMEAQSFGIPVIATDTGAVREIVVEGTGSLLPVDFETGVLSGLIEHYANLPDNEYEILRMNAISNWESNFNAISNYNNFISTLNSILASEK